MFALFPCTIWLWKFMYLYFTYIKIADILSLSLSHSLTHSGKILNVSWRWLWKICDGVGKGFFVIVCFFVSLNNSLALLYQQKTGIWNCIGRILVCELGNFPREMCARERVRKEKWKFRIYAMRDEREENVKMCDSGHISWYCAVFAYKYSKKSHILHSSALSTPFCRFTGVYWTLIFNKIALFPSPEKSNSNNKNLKI